MKTFSITLTETQGTQLLQLLDLAVKSGGLIVAGAALTLHDSIQQAWKAATQTPEAPDSKG